MLRPHTRTLRRQGGQLLSVIKPVLKPGGERIPIMPLPLLKAGRRGDPRGQREVSAARRMRGREGAKFSSPVLFCLQYQRVAFCRTWLGVAAVWRDRLTLNEIRECLPIANLDRAILDRDDAGSSPVVKYLIDAFPRTADQFPESALRDLYP
jgi:hypothetical protein